MAATKIQCEMQAQTQVVFDGNDEVHCSMDHNRVHVTRFKDGITKLKTVTAPWSKVIDAAEGQLELL